MARRERLSKPQKARTYSMIGKYGEYDITAGSYNEAMEKLDKAEKIHEVRLEDPAGIGQTFAESAADEASFGLYSKAKAGLTGEDESLVDARMERNAQENPIAGMAGTGVGLVAGGGGAGMAVKGAAKLAGKGLAKAGAAKVGNYVQKVPVGKIKRGMYEGAAGGAGIEAIEAGKDLYSGDDVDVLGASVNTALGAVGGGVLGKTLSGIPKRLNTKRGTTLEKSKADIKRATEGGYESFDDSTGSYDPSARTLPIDDLLTETRRKGDGLELRSDRANAILKGAWRRKDLPDGVSQCKGESLGVDAKCEFHGTGIPTRRPYRHPELARANCIRSDIRRMQE